jgi:hypothetical protein
MGLMVLCASSTNGITDLVFDNMLTSNKMTETSDGTASWPINNLEDLLSH